MNRGSSHANEHGRISCNDWLGFALPKSNLSLFQNSSPAAAVANAAEEDPAELSMMMGGGEGAKLEDFLGVSSGSNNGNIVFEAVSNKQRRHHQKQQQQRIYEDDLELKTIADESFFGMGNSGGCSENRDHQQQLLTVDQPQHQSLGKKTIESFGQRTSIFRGVTRHRWTGRYEAHLWDNSCRREGQSRKGRQVYLGGYDKEDKAARAYDLAALKYWGPTTTTNFPIGNYERELEEMKHMTRQEFVASLRRRSSGFSRGASMYRGVTRHHQHGRWQARIGRVAGNKDLYLGTFSTQEEAAEAYDIAAIKFRGLNAVTNFDMSRYDVKSIANSNLPIGGMSNKSKASSDSISDSRSENDNDISELSVSFASPHQPINSTLNFALPIKTDPSSCYWPPIQGYINNQITLATPSPNSNTHLMNSYFHMNNPTEAQYQQNNMNIYCSSGSSTAGSDPGSFGTSTMIPPYATPLSMTVTNNNNNSSGGVGTHEQQQVSSNGSGNGNGNGNGNGISNMVAPNVHQYQSGKASLSVFQTPIFGIE